ncbi:MAG: Pla-1/cef family extracellular lipase [Paraglaciecola sp.]|jgi:Pla-1/cef family extracellular lipase
MKKLLLSASITAILGLTGCGGDTIDEQKNATPVAKPFVRVVFDPAGSDLNIPNDLLMIPDGSFFDFTINTEGADTFDPANPQHALSALDGWSTQHPFAIRVTLPAGVDVDPASLSAGAVRIFKATQALEGTDAACQAIAAASPAPGIPCALGEELQYGEDFVTSYTPGSGSINVIPLKPLAPAQGHMLVVTEQLKDTDGKAVRGSTTWDLVRQDIDTTPLVTDEQLQLQGLVNSLVAVLEPAGLDRDEVSYAAYFSTQSAGTVLTSVKQLQIAGFAQAYAAASAQGADASAAGAVAAQYLPTITTTVPATGPNAFEFLAPGILSAEQLAGLTAVGLHTCDGLIAAIGDSDSPLNATATETFNTAGPLCAATRVVGQVNLPYYSNPEDPMGDWWRAACTNGAMLKALGAETVGGLIQGGAEGPNNELCQLASAGQLYDLDLSSLGMDDPRHLTKVNPIPVARGSNTDDPATLYNEAGTETVNVQFTVPNEGVIALLSAATSGAVPALTRPAAGWPVVIFQHGITGSKENTLALSAALSLAGFASAAIDHPLHGERGLTLDDGNVVSATSHSVTDYMNLTSLLTARDNLRQSIVDTMGFRLSLNAIADTTGVVDLDLSQVHFIAQSLGAITGTASVATANASLPGDLAAFNSLYAIQTAVLNVPAGGVGNFLLESADFSPLIKGSLLAASSEDFQAFLTQYATVNEISAEAALRPAFVAFAESLTVEQLAAIDATFSSFAFLAQTVLESADPVNYAASLTATTPTLMQLVVGGGTNDDGTTALTDQVNPVQTSLPLSGGIPLAKLMGLPQVSASIDSDTDVTGVVYITSGEHQSLLNPSPSAATTAEMQNEAVQYFLSGGSNIIIADPDVVAN